MRATARVPVRKGLIWHIHRAAGLPLQTTYRRGYADDAHSNQAHPFSGYYADLLDAPLRSGQPPTTCTPPTAPTTEERPNTEKERLKSEEEKLAKFRTVFGSRQTEPKERKREIESQSQLVAGVLVPPRPEEPDNCCMSGCVNCVWDLYRDEMEEWAARSAEARVKTMEQRVRGEATGMMGVSTGTPSHIASSMDDDGGGSETSWGQSDLGSGGQASSADLFADIPVGIREFMKTEKKLKLKHNQARGTAG